jgi:hypothetical protein
VPGTYKEAVQHVSSLAAESTGPLVRCHSIHGQQSVLERGSVYVWLPAGFTTLEIGRMIGTYPAGCTRSGRVRRLRL